MFFWDWTVIILIPGLLLSLIAQLMVSSAYSKYFSIPAMCGITGRQAAEQILRQGGVPGVTVTRTSGTLTDHFDPRSGVIQLSGGVYDTCSIASIAVAAHESGHAMQYASGYKPLAIRNALLPGSKLRFLFGNARFYNRAHLQQQRPGAVRYRHTAFQLCSAFPAYHPARGV